MGKLNYWSEKAQKGGGFGKDQSKTELAPRVERVVYM